MNLSKLNKPELLEEARKLASEKERLIQKISDLEEALQVEKMEKNQLFAELENSKSKLKDLDREIKILERKLNRKPETARKLFRLPKFVQRVLGAILILAIAGAIATAVWLPGKVGEVSESITNSLVKHTKSDPLTGMVFTKHDGVILAMDAYQSEFPKEVYSAITQWAKPAGFDAVIVGRILTYEKPMLSGKYDLRVVARRLEQLGSKTAFALVDNPSELQLPAPFQVVSKGPIEIYRARQKAAGIIPMPKLLGTDLAVESKNLHIRIHEDGTATVKIDDFSLSVIEPIQKDPEH